MTDKVRAHVFIAGKVQGVYFRQNTMETAKKNGVAGWVRNLPDGRVEAVLEGEKAGVEKVVDWCRRGPPKAQVQEFELKFESYTGDFSDFVISY